MNMSYRINRRRFIEIGLKSTAIGAFPLDVLAEGTRATTLPSKISQWQIGCYTRPWREHDWRIALDAIAEAGFKYAGLMSTKSKTRLVITAATSVDEAKRIGEEAGKRGLGILSVYGGGFPVEQSLEAGIAGLRKLIDNCAAAGAKTLMVGGTGNQALYQRYYKAIAEVCDYALEKKVGIILKPHGGLNATGPQCRKAIELVGHKNFTLWYDPGNIYYYSDGKLNPVEDARMVKGLVTGMCVKDFAMSTQDGKMAKDVLVNPGAGMVDFPAVMDRLKQGGFTRGPLVIETLAHGDLTSLLASAKKARAFVGAFVGK